MIAPWLRGELEEEEEHMQGSLTGEKSKENGEGWKGVIYGILKIY